MKIVNIKTLALALGLATTVATLPNAQAATVILDQVVAIVDDDVIMASELRERLAAITESLKARAVDMPAEDELIRQTLDRLILESIQIQKGQRVGVRIGDAQLNGAMGRIAEQNGMSLEQFSQRLEIEGKSYQEMREQIRREMVLQRVQSGNVNQRIQITPQEVDNFLATEEGQKLTQAEYRLVHALLAIAPDATQSTISDAQAHVDAMLNRIASGEPFDDVVSSNTGGYTFSGGDLGWRKLSDLPSLFADVAPQLKLGETSKAIRSESGLHIVNLQDLRGGEQMVAQTEVRHILIKPSEILNDDQARALIVKIRARAAAGEDFAALAKANSEDIGSAQEGGDLGWTSPGQMVPEFEQEMAKTAIGSLSEPVRSQYGWHLLEITGRRDQDMTELAIRGKASDYLHQRKFQEELDAWLQRIRDEAFVDIK
ncbi:MAG: peptidyl-prolyl cis-trans isomerase SurA [Halioglobus sp.]